MIIRPHHWVKIPKCFGEMFQMQMSWFVLPAKIRRDFCFIAFEKKIPPVIARLTCRLDGWWQIGYKYRKIIKFLEKVVHHFQIDENIEGPHIYWFYNWWYFQVHDSFSGSNYVKCTLENFLVPFWFLLNKVSPEFMIPAFYEFHLEFKNHETRQDYKVCFTHKGQGKVTVMLNGFDLSKSHRLVWIFSGNILKFIINICCGNWSRWYFSLSIKWHSPVAKGELILNLPSPILFWDFCGKYFEIWTLLYWWQVTCVCC